MSYRVLTALPVFNEVDHVTRVLEEVLRYCDDILVVDDGSTDGTSRLLAQRDDIRVVRHEENQGYGAALQSAFAYAWDHDYDILVTIDCDGQHQPRRIPRFIEMITAEETPGGLARYDVVSGSRYLEPSDDNTLPPADRRRINETITAELNDCLGLHLTDAFCGFKAYRAAALTKIELSETGYAMPIEFLVKAAHAGLSIVELPVPLIYLDETRSFGGALDQAETRLAVYRDVLERSLAACRRHEPVSCSCHDDMASPAGHE